MNMHIDWSIESLESYDFALIVGVFPGRRG